MEAYSPSTSTDSSVYLTDSDFSISTTSKEVIHPIEQSTSSEAIRNSTNLMEQASSRTTVNSTATTSTQSQASLIRMTGYSVDSRLRVNSSVYMKISSSAERKDSGLCTILAYLILTSLTVLTAVVLVSVVKFNLKNQ